MSKTNSAVKITRSLHELTGESRVVIFGDPRNHDVAESVRKANTTRSAQAIGQPNFDTNTGPCGLLCHCKETCLKKYDVVEP